MACALPSRRPCSLRSTIGVWVGGCSYCIKTLQHEEWVKRIVISEDGATIVTASYDQVRQRCQQASLCSPSFLANLRPPKTIRTWDLAKGECTGVYRGHDHVIETIALSPGTTPCLTQENESVSCHPGQPCSASLLALPARPHESVTSTGLEWQPQNTQHSHSNEDRWQGRCWCLHRVWL